MSLAFDKVFSSAQAHALPEARSWQEAAFARFKSQGVPSTRHEDWRYTSLSALEQTAWSALAPGAALAQSKLDSLVGARWTHRLILHNGRFDEALSTSQPPKGVKWMSLRQACTLHPEWVKSSFLEQDDALGNLNAALAQDGVVIIFEKGAQSSEPIEVIHWSDAPQPVSIHPHSLIMAQEGSLGTVVERFVSGHSVPYFHNPLLKVSVEGNAEIRHYRHQDESLSAVHLSNVWVQQKRSSRFFSHAIQTGAALGRHEVRVKLAGEGARAELVGLYLGQQDQLLDNHTVIEHFVPRCESVEVFKGVLSDKARGVFNGKIVVRQNAIGTQSHQINRNLLLSDQALADTRPQLEIFADDVKCSHGATVGRLDDKALFYLRSRGIPVEKAKNILTYAFARELVEKIQVPTWREMMAATVTERLPGGRDLGDWT